MARRASIRVIRLAAALVVALVSTASLAAGARAIQLTTIVLEGDDAPGAPFPFTTFTLLLHEAPSHLAIPLASWPSASQKDPPAYRAAGFGPSPSSS